MSNNSNNNLRSAMRLYQENGDPITSLRECQKVWNSSAATAMKDNTEGGGASSSMKQQWPISRQHNEAILQNLAAQRQRSRRVRPRPSSFDADSSSADDNNSGGGDVNNNAADEKGDEQPQRPSATTTATTAGANNDEEETDLITLLNNMLTLSIQRHQNSTPTPPSDDSQQQQLDNDQKVQLLITSYNLSLSHYAQGNYTRALQVLGGVFLHWMEIVSIVTNNTTTTTNNNGKKVDKKDGSGGKNSNSHGKEWDGGDKQQQQQMMVQFNYNNNNNSDNNTTTMHHLPLNSTHVKSILAILTRIAFLVLDCLLNVHVGDGRGVAKDSLLEETLLWDESETGDSNDNQGEEEEMNNNNNNKKIVLRVQDVLKWVENVILAYAKQRTKNNNSGSDGDDEEGGMMVSGGENNSNNDDVLKADEVKFKLHLYKSRVLLQGTRDGSSKMTQDGETRARLARKELKNAMDIYQNKLCVVEDGNSSISEGKGGGDGNEKKKNKKGGGKGGDKQRGGKGNSTNNHHHHQQDTSETTSISGSLVTSASDGLWNEGKGGVVARATFEGMPNNKQKQPEQQQQQQQQQQQSPPQKASASSTPSATPVVAVKVKVKKDIPGLHVRHESALYMKANLEYLRGNTTKSLKLCAEARTAGRKSRAEEAKNINGGGGQSEENGFVNNNDAAAANGNKTEAATEEEEDVETQMANDYDEAIYYNNLAMVHQSAGKIHVALHYYSYAISYMENVQLPNDNYFWSDGVARPNVTADILNNVSLCAFQAHDYKRAYECMARCVTLSPSILGKRARCWLRMAQSLIGIHANQQWTTNTNESVGLVNDTSLIECNLGSEDDLRNISTNPFPRILSCLEKAQHLSSGLKEGQNMDPDLDCFEAATLSLAYAKLELKDAAGALEMCKVVLGSDNIAAIAKEDRSNHTSESLRRRAMARLYACEAFCRLGDPKSALFIVESESSLRCLASDMSASNSTQHDAYAQFATRATASGTFSSTGSFERSKLHASMTTGVAAKLTVDKTKGNVDNVFEKRVHLFSRLKEGDTDGAIAILRSGLGRV